MMINNAMRILLVDPDAAALQPVQSALEAAGYEVDTASDAVTALQRVRSGLPMLVLLAAGRDECDGRSLCREIRTDLKSAHVIVIFTLDSVTGEDEALRCLDDGADGFIQLPLGDRALRYQLAAFSRVALLQRDLMEANRKLDKQREKLKTVNRALEQSQRETLGLLEGALQARRQTETLAARLDDGELAAHHLEGIGQWELDAATQRVRWSEEVRKIYEWPTPATDVSLDEWLQAYTPDGRKALEEALTAAREQGTPWDQELPFQAETGQQRWVRVMIRPGTNSSLPTSLRGTIIDITDRKQVEADRASLSAQLVNAQKMESVGLLAGGIAHEFNNKLQTIIGFAEMSALSCEEGSPLHEELQTIKVAAREAAELTRQLLAYASKQVARPQRLELNETVEEVMGLLKRSLGEMVRVDWDPGTRLWPVRMDPAQVDQIVTNLALNARDAMPQGGTLTVMTRNSRVSASDWFKPADRPAGEYVRIAVRDTGTGIPATLLDRIFDPFFTTKPLGKGTGLGLSTVFGIARQNNGFVRVDSSPGDGATFSVYLPRDRSAVMAEPGESDAAPVGGHETILVAEDEEAILDLTQMYLGRLGYTVLTAPTPKEAIQVAEAHQWKLDLLLTDVIMPGMNGKQLYQSLRVHCPQLRVLYMSGHSAGTLDEQGVLADDVWFLTKPFEHQQLARMVRQVLDTKPVRGDRVKE